MNQLGCNPGYGYCRGTGDPRYETFDNLYYDFTGHGSYDYVISFNNDISIDNGVPFIITCEPNSFGTVSWASYSFIILYNSTGNKVYELISQFEYPILLKGNNINKNEEYIFDNSLNWSLEITTSGSDIVMTTILYGIHGLKYHFVNIHDHYKYGYHNVIII